ncbi:MAG: hypothetical protein DKM50_08475 [Candidatus Margulisiibacteriota bacterium]|nr:MAG: hypothetical protein A2X43_11970 [Candidatus Margulisbacteria bacterium GWD2_39_127]OGI01856.1 MAG: hypothetical protein A2X42_04495 [Candidatus Margulisbacteria bacterium GWF2_38_17]OGI10178.1 MAG: hypothetical protein A2X41_01215 [Candidatus Margulisbacteria bacterium GWE2_39_32]PZM79485.1 MAG: hypothetical protein DKM50_08475 [Candidatus Margulisiibacteriota bacterium]HAR63844.1 hypothetical protein [Candidatus Margulisiibacteriota bacterium]
MTRYKKEVIFFVKIFFINFILFNIMLFLWSNYDDAKSLDIVEYINVFFGDLKQHFFKIFLESLLFPLIISMFIFEIILTGNRYFLDSNKLTNHHARLTLKVLLATLGFLLIYFCGPIVFFVVVLPFIVAVTVLLAIPLASKSLKKIPE